LLVDHFIHILSGKIGTSVTAVSKHVLEQIINYDWPGNIRELEHAIERSILLSDDDILRQIYLPCRRLKDISEQAANGSRIKTIEENERDHIIHVLRQCKGRVAGYTGAAKSLGVPASTLASKLKRLGIEKAHY
jgi:transcriptional regulator with GAF, ATPase, and Fis domain